MKTQSACTTAIDPYEAGLELGGTLNSTQPEAIILFSSVHYADFEELFEGLYDGLETRDVTIFGGTGDGFYESSKVESIGASALAFNSGGTIQWKLTLEDGVSADSFDAGQRCGRKLCAEASDASLAFIMTGMACDGTQLIKALQREYPKPCIGGIAGDNRQFDKGYVFANGVAYTDAIAALTLSGDIAFASNLGSGWTPIGRTASVDLCKGNVISRIGGQTTVEFINQQFGAAPAGGDPVVALAAYGQSETANFAMRTPYQVDNDTGAITYFGSVTQGTPVRVCFATREDVVNGVNETLKGIPELDFKPEAAIVITCAGRKWILGHQTSEEVKRLRPNLPKDLSLIGLPTYGEFAPYLKDDGTYSESVFHNVTYIVTLIGQRSK